MLGRLVPAGVYGIAFHIPNGKAPAILGHENVCRVVGICGGKPLPVSPASPSRGRESGSHAGGVYAGPQGGGDLNMRHQMLSTSPGSSCARN